MSNLIDDQLRSQLRSWGASLVGGELKFDDPQKDAAYRQMLAEAGQTIEAKRADRAKEAIERSREGNDVLLDLQRGQSDLRLREGAGLADLRRQKSLIDSDAFSRDQATATDQQLRILGAHSGHELELDRGITDRMDRNIAYFDRNDERRLALEREKLGAYKSGQVMNLISNILRGAAVMAL